jgi:hypothetical protein
LTDCDDVIFIKALAEPRIDSYVVCTKSDMRLIKIKKAGLDRFKVFEEAKERMQFDGKPVKSAV